MKSAAPNPTNNKNINMVGGVFIPNFAIRWQAVLGTGFAELVSKEWLMLKPHVIVYSRPGCHLCEEAKAAIMSAGCDNQFTLEEINIESDRELLRKYQYDIPVIAIDGVESSKHRVDPKEFKTRITRINESRG